MCGALAVAHLRESASSSPLQRENSFLSTLPHTMTPRDLVVLLASFCLSCDAFRLPAAGLRLPAGAAASSASSSSCCRMMFGGAGGKPDGEGGMGGFMEQVCAAVWIRSPASPEDSPATNHSPARR